MTPPGRTSKVVCETRSQELIKKKGSDRAFGAPGEKIWEKHCTCTSTPGRKRQKVDPKTYKIYYRRILKVGKRRAAHEFIGIWFWCERLVTIKRGYIKSGPM